VVPVQGRLVLDDPWPDAWCFQEGFSWTRFACCNSYWPQQYRNPGAANADYVIILTTRPTRGSLLAWALECMADQVARPTAGHVNLSPARVSTDPKEFSYQLSVIIHEIMHALGFNANKMAFFRKPGTLDPVDAETDVISRAFDVEQGKTVTKVITPHVVAAAQAHYGCFNWPGAGMELEDGGGGGTAGSHWEKRTAMYDIMNGVSERAMYKSAITLAFFKDSGWYSVDYSRSERLPWGNGEGCDFVTRKCSAWDTGRYFCTTEGELGCTTDLRYGAACSLATDAISRPSHQQYFGTPFKGGSSSISDYCPYFQGYTNRDCTDTGTVQFFYYGEAAGAGARCFKGTYQLRSVSAALRTHSGCLQAQCDVLTNAITVTLAASPPLVVRCPRAGGVVDLAGLENSAFVGTLICPRSDLLCSGDACALNDCSGHGVCNPVDGTCACSAGYYGADNFTCNYRTCPGLNGTQCSGHGFCNRNTGVCEDGAGRAGCFPGFRGSDCGEIGCPSATTTECPSGTCECGGRGTCSAGTCTCTTGYSGSACQYINCPSALGSQCGGAQRGACDLDSGICACSSSASAAGGTVHYLGPACGSVGNGTRPITLLAYATTGLTSGGANSTFNGTLQPGEYAYFGFDVPSIEYGLQVVVATNATASQLVRGVASYESSGLPSLSRRDFASISTGLGSLRIDFVPSTTSSASSFNRLGRMIVAIVATGAPVRIALQLQRDGCAVLRCDFGTCSDGTCICSPGWSGPLCNVADCPGSPDCGNRGTCDAAGTRTSAGVAIAGAQPACRCSTFYSGPSCDELAIPGYNDANRLRFSSFLFPDATNPSLGTATSGVASLWKDSAAGIVFINTSFSGEVGVGDGAMAGVISSSDIANHVSGAFTVLMRVTFPDTPRADGIMLGNENSVPALSMVGSSAVDFDVSAWRQALTQQLTVRRIPNAGGSTLYMAKVFNGRYGQERLRFTWQAEIAAGACPPSMAACSGHGVCNPATALCTCSPGWRGLLCDTPVAALTLTPTGDAACTRDATCLSAANITLVSQPPGSWAYWSLAITPATASVKLALSTTSPRGRAVMLAVFESALGASSLAAVTSELAHMDIDNAGNIAKPGQPTQRLRLRRKPGDAAMLIAVKVPADVHGTFAGQLTISQHDSSTTPRCVVGNTTCTVAACHGRGVYLADASCRCELGWNDDSDCASPRLASDSAIVPAAQSLEAMCTVCSKTSTLANGGVSVFGVPPALQKGKLLRVSATAVVGGNASIAGGTPAVFASPVLPRSIADFATIASGPTANATMLLGSSPTGKHYVAVYAHYGGTFRLAATRFDTTVTPLKPPSFASMLSVWLFATPAGNIVLGLGGGLLLMVVSGCVIQRLTHRSTSKRLAAAHEAIKSVLGNGDVLATGALQQAIRTSAVQQELLSSRPAMARLLKLRRMPAYDAGGGQSMATSAGGLPRHVLLHPLFRSGPQMVPTHDDMLWKDMAGLESRLGGDAKADAAAAATFDGTPAAPEALHLASHTALRNVSVPRHSFLFVPASQERIPTIPGTHAQPAPAPPIAIALPAFAIAGLQFLPAKDTPPAASGASPATGMDARLQRAMSRPAITHNPLRAAPSTPAGQARSVPPVDAASGVNPLHSAAAMAKDRGAAAFARPATAAAAPGAASPSDLRPSPAPGMPAGATPALGATAMTTGGAPSFMHPSAAARLMQKAAGGGRRAKPSAGARGARAVAAASAEGGDTSGSDTDSDPAVGPASQRASVRAVPPSVSL